MGPLEESYMILITELAFQPHAYARVNFRNVCTNAVSVLCKLVKKKFLWHHSLQNYIDTEISEPSRVRIQKTENTGLTVKMKFKLAVF